MSKLNKDVNAISLNRVFDDLFNVFDNITYSNFTTGSILPCTNNESTISDPIWYTTPDYHYSNMIPNYNEINYDQFWKDLRDNLSQMKLVHSANGSFPFTNFYINKVSKEATIEIALAGYKKDDIKITFDEDLLIIKGIINKDSKKDEDYFIVSNKIKKSNFEISFDIPFSKYDVDNSSANFIDGILKINIPVKESEKPKRLEIKVD